MLPGPNIYQVACAMLPDQATGICEVIKLHNDFSNIVIDVNSDRGTYTELQDTQIPNGSVLVIFHIPREGINMVDFFGIFRETLSMVHGERAR